VAQLTVGLDLGCESIKRVRLSSSFRTVEVVDFTRIPVPSDDRQRPERVAEALQQLEGSDRPADLVATGLPGDEVAIHLLTMPFSDRKRIAQTIGLELESQIPFSLDKVVFDYLQSGQTDTGGSRLLLAFCQIERMARWLEVYNSAGLDPRLIGPDCLAYTTLVDYLSPPEEDRAVAVVDIGHRLTSLCIIGPGGAEFARTISGGGLDITNRLAEAFKVKAAKAEAGKRRSGFVESDGRTATTPEQALISDAVKRATSSIVRELRQTFSSHFTAAKRPIKKIWLCGGTSAVENLDWYLSGELDVEVERIRTEHFDLPGMEHLENGDPGTDRAADGESANGNTWVKALGLALHAHQGGRRDFLSLRKGPFAHKGDFEIMRGKIVHVAVALLILAFLAIGHAVTSYLSLSSAESKLNARMKETTKAIIGREIHDPEVAVSIIKERLSPEGDLLPRYTALDVLREVHKLIPDDLDLKMKYVKISPKKIQIGGLTDSFGSAEKIRTSLSKYECFNDVRTGKTRKTKEEDKVEFELTIVFGC
jgi:general secretion pathway protein L